MRSAVPGQMDEAVIRSDPNRTFLKRGLRHGKNRAVGFLETAPVFLLLVIPGEIRADRLPTASFVGRAEKNVSSGVHHAGIVRRNNDRKRPLKAIFHLRGGPAARIVRPDRDIANFAGLPVISCELSKITSGVDGIPVRA